MARHRFRSQPTLQRSGGSARSGLLALSLLAAAGVAVGGVVGELMQGSPPPVIDQPLPTRPIDQPVTVAETPAPRAAPQVAAAPAQPSPAAPRPSLPKPKPKALAHVARPARAPPEAAAPVEKAPQTWARQQEDYQRARAAYDADERKAGYRWAQANRIRVQRYCHVEAQRTPAFVEGCLSWLRQGRADGAAKPAEAHIPGQG